MYTASISSSAGTLVLTNNEDKYQIMEITGIDPPTVNVNTTYLAGIDGSMFNFAKLNNRNIVIMMKINGNVEANRQAIYAKLPLKAPITFYFKNVSKDVKISGYVDSISCPLFTGKEVIQISLICPNPVFMENRVRTSQIAPVGSTINNQNQTIGVTITVTVVSDFSAIVITNVSTITQSIILSGTWIAGDTITVNTRVGEKSVVLTRNGAATNIFSFLDIVSELFPLSVGFNRISYEIDGNAANSSKANVSISYSYEYGGV